MLALCLLATSVIAGPVPVLTYHNDLSRTGANLSETALTTTNVNVNGFGKLFTRVVDDELYAQLLYVPAVNVPGRGTHNIVYAATVNNSVYAFDADFPDESAPLWLRNFNPENGRPVRNTDLSQGGACGGNYRDFSGNIGIVGTPVIDPAPFPGAPAGDQGTIYFVTRTKVGAAYLQHIHALNIRDGSSRPGSPVQITATVSGTGEGSSNGQLAFNSFTHNQRPGLLLLNGVVYITWASHCDLGPYHGWMIGYNATTLAREVIYNSTPTGGNGGIWMGGQPPSADAAGNIYLSTGNGTIGLNGDPQNTTNRGMSFMKLTPNAGTVNVSSFFTPFNYQSLEAGDVDLGSTGLLLVPETTPALAVGAGKQGRMYVVNRDNMGGFNTNGVNDNQIVQSIDVKLNNKIMGSPIYWKDANNVRRLFVWCANDNLKAYTFNTATGKFTEPPAASTVSTANPGAMLSLTANGATSGTGIVWAMCPTADANQQVVPGFFRAFNAQTLQELWNSRQNVARDDFGNYAKFNPPTVTNGRVYLPTFSNQIVVYGLITPPVVPTAPTNLQAVAATKTEVGLTWTDNSSDEAGFRIERSTNNVDFVQIENAAAGATNFTDLTVEPFTTYYYRVRAYTLNGSSAFTNTATATTDVGAPEPEIDLLGQGQRILSGDATPTVLDGTDFGAIVLPGGAAIVRTFTVQNLGNASLSLNGTPRVQLSGADAANFSVEMLPASSVPGPGSTTFQIRFAATTPGTKLATVTIASNDLTEPAYTLAVKGAASFQNLVAWWKFNEPSGAVATDSSGNGHDGALLAPVPQWTSAGRLDGALAFTGAVGQSVIIDSTAALNPTAEISVTAWIFPDAWGSNRRILQKGAGDNQYRLLAEEGVMKWHLSGVGMITAALPATGVWTHLAANYDGATMRLFYDGAEVASLAASGSIATTGDPVNISTKTPGATGGDHFTGRLDDIRVYARALSASEIGVLAAQTGSVSIGVSDGTAQKGTSDTATFTFTRTGTTAAPLTVNFDLPATPGLAVYRTDYGLTPLPPTVTIPAGQTSGSLTVTPIYVNEPTGTLNVIATVAEGAGYGVGATSSATVQILDSPLNQWKITKFGGLAGAQSVDANDTSDWDLDGTGNLVEFGVNSNPTASDRASLPVAAIENVAGGEYLTLTFRRPRPAPLGISYVIETKTDIEQAGSWSLAIAVAGFPLNNNDGTETVKFRATSQASAQSAGFIRLRMTRP